jgi:hypothetical protein
MLDIQLMQLQYEILNTSVSMLAADAGVSIQMMQDEIESLGWVRRWPESEEELDTQEAYVEATKQRLKVYTLAKDMLLAQRYLELEVGIIKAAQKALDAFGDALPPQQIKYLSALYKDLTSGTSLANLATMAFEGGENGVPMVVFRDVSGSKTQ